MNHIRFQKGLFSAILAGIVAVTVVSYFFYTKPPRQPKLPLALVSDTLLATELQNLASAAAKGHGQEWMDYGSALLGQGLYLHAESAFRRALSFDSQNIDMCFALGFCLDRTGRIEESIELYKKCLLLPESQTVGVAKKPLAQYAIGRNYLRLGELVKAESAFRMLPMFAPAEYQLALILFFSNRPKESLSIIERGIEKLPLSLEWHHLKARVFDAMGQPNLAFAARTMEERSAHLLELHFSTLYMESLTQQYGLNRLLTDYGEAIKKQNAGDLDQRLTNLSKVVGQRRIPEQQILTKYRAKRALQTGLAQESLNILDTAEEGYGIPSATRSIRAEALEQLGNDTSARKTLQATLTLNPSADVHRKLAFFLELSGESTKSKYHLSEAEYLEGISTYHQNDLSGSLTHFEEALRLNPQNSKAWFHRGETEFHLGKKEMAYKSLEEASRISPHNGKIQSLLTFLQQEKVP